MIYSTYKFKSIKDFISNNDSKAVEILYSLRYTSCYAVQEDYSIDDTCFYCNFCAFGDTKTSYSEKLCDFDVNSILNSSFTGSPIKVPNAKFYLNNVNNKNLETFTSIEETRRIQLWATGIFSQFTPYKCTTAIEIPAPNEDFHRDGRIDIGVRENDNFLFIETKTTLTDAMNDERFVEQHSKYKPVIEESITFNQYSYLLGILIGGRETDLFPSNSKHCTGQIGRLSDRFYNLLSTNKDRIPFISASALWCLSLIHLKNDNFSVTDFLINLFKDENCYGLLSAGKVMYQKNSNTFLIKTISI